MSARCGRLRRQSLFIDRCVHSRSVQKWPLPETVEHISYYEHVHAAVTSRFYLFFYFFLATEIASHSFPVPRSESRNLVYLNATFSNVRAFDIPTIRHDRHDFTDNRLLQACRGQRFAFVRQITLHDEHGRIGKSRGQQAAVNYTLNDRKSELNVLERDNRFSHGSLAHAS